MCHIVYYCFNPKQFGYRCCSFAGLGSPSITMSAKMSGLNYTLIWSSNAQSLGRNKAFVKCQAMRYNKYKLDFANWIIYDKITVIVNSTRTFQKWNGCYRNTTGRWIQMYWNFSWWNHKSETYNGMLLDRFLNIMSLLSNWIIVLSSGWTHF